MSSMTRLGALALVFALGGCSSTSSGEGEAPPPRAASAPAAEAPEEESAPMSRDDFLQPQIDLARRDTMNKSAQMASTIVDDLRRTVKLLRRTHRFAGFAVLKAPDVPSVLVEMGYLSHREEESLLRTRAYRDKLTGAIAGAVDHFFTDIEKASRP